LEAGQLEEAQVALDEAFVAVNTCGERMVEAELHRLQGGVLLAQAEEDEAEICFHRAIEVARGQRAKSWELRATMDLSRLWDRQGKQREAQRMLQELYGCFTEGFDTPDLREARRLLD
jgi:adenylate cyclase